jgi:2-polyprenyl-6-methoxyphenol hydroxylase-like FAD-dependent oxidoreductase
MSGRADYSIIGDGPGGCASAVLLSAMGHAVTLYGRRPRRREAAAAVGGLTLLEADKTIVASDIHFTESIAEAITGVRNIVLAHSHSYGRSPTSTPRSRRGSRSRRLSPCPSWPG